MSTRLHRDAMCDAREVLTTRNDAPLFDYLLRNEPQKDDTDDYYIWVDYMQSRYAQPTPSAVLVLNDMVLVLVIESSFPIEHEHEITL